MSIVIQGCLDTAIGLSQTECDCFDTGKPVDYNVSDSGLFLDEIDGLPLNVIDAAADCTNGSVWDIMDRAKRDATILLKGDVNILLSKNVIPSRPFFYGNIGEPNPKGYNDPTGQYCGVTFLSDGIPSGSIRIKKLRLAINTTVAKTVYLYSSLQDAPLGSWSVNCVQNQYSEVNVNITLPLTDGNACGVRYWFVYDKTGIKPMQTKLTCGCGNSSNALWNGLNFLQHTMRIAKTAYNWQYWLNVAGTHGNDLLHKTSWGCNSMYTHGIQLDVELECALSDVLCQNLDYENNPAAIKLAEALRYKAGEKVINIIMSTGNINRYTLLDNESMWGRRNHYAKRYTETLAEAVAAMDLSRSGCYKCKPGMMVTTI